MDGCVSALTEELVVLRDLEIYGERHRMIIAYFAARKVTPNMRVFRTTGIRDICNAVGHEGLTLVLKTCPRAGQLDATDLTAAVGEN
ncbi:hypothetical protein NDU88_005487 [Pleurodeles waltl]|uniref:Uncharacterized protein n=1 Tax=Pleurodeles waltl TaxID=8319 RepID=A0AAV7WYP3_PLEWA|nr:hypothetical protein NDU88_005487 [Pleurodeles waltl]